MTDCSVFRISDHAAGRYCTRVMERPPTIRRKRIARGRLARELTAAKQLDCSHLTNVAEPLEAYRLGDCVVYVKNLCVTTEVTCSQYDRVAGTITYKHPSS